MKLLKAPYCYLIHWLSDYRLLKIVLFEFFFKIVLNFCIFLLNKIDLLQEWKVCRGKMVPVETGYEIRSTFVI